MSPVLLHRLAAALALPLALTACGGDPITPPPLTPATSTVSTPTPTEQPETAEQFIRRWVDLGNQMQNTGETADYLAVSARCEACSGVAEDVRRFYAAGGFIRTRGWEILKIGPVREGSSTVVVPLVVESHPTEYATRAGAKVQTLPGGRIVREVSLRRVGRYWQVTELVQVAR